MPDLAAQIREQLYAWQQPTAIIETPKVLNQDEYDDLLRRFKAAQLEPHEIKVSVVPPSADERMRRALLAVLELHADDETTVRTVATALGIEAA
jgi:hypothetical protein